MASALSITVGALTAERTFANDAKVSATLLAFYTAANLGPADATNRQKLEAILDWLVGYIRGKAIAQHVEGSRTAAESEAETTYGFS